MAAATRIGKQIRGLQVRNLLIGGSGAFVSTLAPAHVQHRLVVAVVAVAVALFAAIAPFAKVPLAPVPPFIAGYQGALLVVDVITAALLFSQYAILRTRELAILASGYAFTACVTLAHGLTFPGVFTPSGLLGAGPQTTAWLYMLWHAGFPLFVCAYALTDASDAPEALSRGVLGWAAVAVGLAGIAVLVATAGMGWLPTIMAGHKYTPAMLAVVTAVWAVPLVAGVLLWRRRPQSVLDLWLMVVMCVWTLDVALSAVLNAGRYDVGFYAGRLFGLVAAMFVLVVLLVEHGLLYAGLAKAHEAERRRGGELDAMNASLEQRVAARTEELDEARQKLAGIIDSAMDAVITVDEGQRIILFNAAAEQVFGLPRAEALGLPLTDLMPQRFRESHGTHLQRFGASGGTTRRMGGQRVVMGLRRNGEEFPLDASISQLQMHGHRFYTVILRDVTERERAEQALVSSRQELHEIATASAAAREQEKGRIARELHDELGQQLTALRLDIDFVGLAAGADPAIAAKVAAMRALVDATVVATRRIASDLRPMLLDDLGAVPAIEWLVEQFGKRCGIPVSLAVDPPDLELAGAQATSAYRIVQEALTNVARHAQATDVRVMLRRTGDELVLAVQDDGRGFDLAAARRPNAFGLVGLRERAYLVNGRITIDSAPGEGTRVEAVLPLGG